MFVMVNAATPRQRQEKKKLMKNEESMSKGVKVSMLR